MSDQVRYQLQEVTPVDFALLKRGAQLSAFPDVFAIINGQCEVWPKPIPQEGIHVEYDPVTRRAFCTKGGPYPWGSFPDVGE